MSVDALVQALIPVVCCLFSSRGIIHYFQLESYQFPGYFRTLRRNPVHAFLPGVLSTGACICLELLAGACGNLPLGWKAVGLVAVLALSGLAGSGIARFLSPKKAKKKLVFTNRVKRLYVVTAVLMTVFSLLMQRCGVLWTMLWPLLLPLWVALCGLAAWPIEKLISECYFRDARRKLLSNPDLIRIGITGSYGKTTVKHILGTILAEKYPVLFTPASFNTPMGVTRTIREKLEPSHRIFIGEMGARHVGDIRELCRLVHPTIGIITSVGPQHLETFHTIERVASTKYELIEALPQEGSRSYFWDDGSFCTAMYEKTTKSKTLCGTDPKRCDHWFDNVTVDHTGSSFDLYFSHTEQIHCHTKLLGEHNIQNILLASACALDLGVSPKQIQHGIEKLQPVAHRLQILPNAAGFTVIDDAFNTNPVSSKASLKVLASFPGRRIVITPGMVELGEKEAEYNRQFGRDIAASADIAIVIGKNRAQPILEGLRDGGFPDASIYRVDSLQDSTSLLYRLVQNGDVVLYENDLPDHYQEA